MYFFFPCREIFLQDNNMKRIIMKDIWILQSMPSPTNTRFLPAHTYIFLCKRKGWIEFLLERVLLTGEILKLIFIMLLHSWSKWCWDASPIQSSAVSDSIVVIWSDFNNLSFSFPVFCENPIFLLFRWISLERAEGSNEITNECFFKWGTSTNVYVYI